MKLKELSLERAQALEMKLQSGDVSADKAAQIQNQLAYIYLIKKKNELAMEYCGKALAYYQQEEPVSNAPYIQLEILIIRALAHQDQGIFDSSYLNQAVDYYNALNLRPGFQNAVPACHSLMLNLGILQFQVAALSSLYYEGMLQKVERNLVHTIQIKLGFDAYTYEHLAKMYQKIAGEEPIASIKIKQLNQALEHLDKALESYSNIFGEDHDFLSGLIEQKRQIVEVLVQIKKKEEEKLLAKLSLFAEDRVPSSPDSERILLHPDF